MLFNILLVENAEHRRFWLWIFGPRVHDFFCVSPGLFIYSVFPRYVRGLFTSRCAAKFVVPQTLHILRHRKPECRGKKTLSHGNHQWIPHGSPNWCENLGNELWSNKLAIHQTSWSHDCPCSVSQHPLGPKLCSLPMTYEVFVYLLSLSSRCRKRPSFGGSLAHRVFTSSTAQGGGGNFKNRKPIGEIGCCESGMAERIHWWTERCLRSPLFLSLSLTIYLPTSLSSIYLSIYLSLCLSFICLSVYLSIYLSVYLSTCLSVVQCHSV